MKYLILSFLCFSISVQAQIAISSSIVVPKSETMHAWLRSDATQGIEAAISYRFTPFQKRIEIAPSIQYGNFFLDNHSMWWTGGSVAAALYPFDFEGDCNCPTFSKRGTLVKKGLFFEVLGGLNAYRANYDLNPEDYLNTESNFTLFHVGAGMGLDIGLNDYFTITPNIRYLIYPNKTAPFPYPNTEGEVLFLEENLTTWQMGLRVQYNFER